MHKLPGYYHTHQKKRDTEKFHRMQRTPKSNHTEHDYKNTPPHPTNRLKNPGQIVLLIICARYFSHGTTTEYLNRHMR